MTSPAGSVTPFIVTTTTGETLVKIDVAGGLTLNHLIGGSVSPTVDVSTGGGIGGGAVASLSGKDLAGYVVFSTTDDPLTNGSSPSRGL